MPSSQIFAINNQGRVYSLSTDQSVWRELPYLGVEFKRVSAHETVIWALGGDHQVYVYVYGSSVPIRVCEEAYENQRWNPIEGFSGVLLPSDRPSFSSEDGLTNRKIADITLPTLAWSWESHWHLHHTHEGQALDKEGWTYAVDFPRTYTAEKKWNSCVRRRKWVRYRRYVALDTWSAVPPIHQDHTKEPFIDITVGGGEVAGEDLDKLMVWGVTVFGRVMVRSGVDGTCPEGCSWQHIPTPPERDVTTVGVGRSGRVWSVTWDGTILVRTGVTRDAPTGVDWIVVEPPNGSPLQQVAVGTKSVWALTRDHKVWFRRGLQASKEAASEHNRSGNGTSQSKADTGTTGNSWLEMVGMLNMISVGPNDQVWGIGSEDYNLLIRTGITETELTGRTWRPICLPIDVSVTPEPTPSPSPAPSPGPLSKVTSGRESNTPVDGGLKKLEPQCDGESLLSVQSSDGEDFQSMATAMDNLKLLDNSASPPGGAVSAGDESENKNNTGLPNLQLKPKDEANVTGAGEKNETSPGHDSRDSSIKIRYPEDYPSSLSSSVVSDPGGEFISSFQASESSPVANGVIAVSVEGNKSKGQLVEGEAQGVPEEDRQSTKSDRTEEQTHEGPPSMQHSSGEWSESRLRHVSSSSAGSEAGLGRGSLVVTREEKPEYNVIPFQAEHLWLWISGGGCWVSANNMPRCAEVLQKLHWRHNKEIKPFEGYEEAVEGSSWAIRGQCRWWAGGQLVPATLELTMVGSRRSEVQDATLVVHYNLGSAKTVEISCCAILMSVISVEPGTAKSVVGIYHPSEPLHPKALVFSAETDAEDWLNHISNACNQFRGLTGRPSSYTVWAVTTRGDVYLHDCSVTEEELRAESVAAHKHLPIGSGATPVTLLLDRGFRPGCFISVSGKIHDKKADQFHINLQTSRGTDANIALHLNPRFSINAAVLNTKKKGHWGHEVKTDLSAMTPGAHCEISIVCDDKDFKISVNDKFWYSFNHRLSAADITHVVIRGSITVDSVTYNHGAGERQLNEWYWRGLGGHCLRVESGAGGVTWAISHDYHVYTYTGATGGGLYKGSSNDSDVNIMSDVRHMYVWENQRWNPVTGFTHRGLPTDRHTWSDQTGRHHRTQEGTKLPSRHWSWMSEWCVDYHTPGGVDREGWQYATDFPLSYHGHRYMTDLVRRRRWVRKCCISTSGPWQQMEKVALVNLSVSGESECGCECESGCKCKLECEYESKCGESECGCECESGCKCKLECEYESKCGESECGCECESGCKCKLECEYESKCGESECGCECESGCKCKLECEYESKCGESECGCECESGCKCKLECEYESKCGESECGCECESGCKCKLECEYESKCGRQWVNVDAPNQPLLEIGAGAGIVWGLERGGGLYRRTNVLPLFPEGTSWEWVCGNVASISVGADGTLWAVLDSFDSDKGPVQGVIARRVGVSHDCPVGTSWEHTLGTGWSHVSARVPLPL
ncbi:tectonin beta-propeller repeat-containing protein 1-like [Penaeus indicus]|uniref:tectonin beta-propeller repeat-containing protein 1-like n=1 Tax=Penaeus indicus TaxID=29960 RepID=UPI00300CEA02